MELLGQGIQHSASPGMWNRLFSAASYSCTYGLRDVDEFGLTEAMNDLRSGRVTTYHVTMPFKTWAFEATERAEPEVSLTGVANCLALEDHVVVGANTDVAAARILLAELPERPRRVLVLGAGATGTSLALACTEVADDVLVANRTPERSQQLAGREWADAVTPIRWAERDAAAASVDLVVNATSCGLTTPESPLHAWPSAAGALYDLVYRPGPTALQILAGAGGAVIVDGLAHLQAHAEATLPRLGLSSPGPDVLRMVLAETMGQSPSRWDRLATT